jgi:hypothetical protein
VRGMEFKNFFNKATTNKEAQNATGFNRREFLKYTAVAAASVGVGGAGGNFLGSEVSDISKGKTIEDYKLDIKELINQTELAERILDLQAKIKERYDIDVFVDQEDLDTTSVVGSHPDSELRLTKQIEGLEILSEELEKYPDFMIKQYGLRVMALTTKARNQNRNTNGYHLPGNIDSTQELDLPEIVFHYDWNSPYLIPKDKRFDFNGSKLDKSEQDKIWQTAIKQAFKETVHHELLHFMLDESGSEQTPRYEELSFTERWDKEFRPINDELRSLYINTDPSVTDNGTITPDFSRISEDVPGAARGYSLKSEEEDRSTIAEHIMLYGIDKRVENDSILKQKVDLMQAYYRDASCGLIDRRYWVMLAPVGSTLQMQQHFKAVAKQIVETPHDQSAYKNQVTKEKYESWQNKLRHTDLVGEGK